MVELRPVVSSGHALHAPVTAIVITINSRLVQTVKCRTLDTTAATLTINTSDSRRVSRGIADWSVSFALRPILTATANLHARAV